MNQAKQIPVRKGYFVQATNGHHLNVWLCGNHYRARELFEERLAILDPFVNMRGEPTAVKAWKGYAP